MISNIYDFIIDIVNFLQKIGVSFWGFLNTPVLPYLQELKAEEIALSWLLEPLSKVAKFAFGDNGTLLTALPGIIALLLIFHIINSFRR